MSWGENLLLALHQVPVAVRGCVRVLLGPSLPFYTLTLVWSKLFPLSLLATDSPLPQDHAALEAERQKMSALVRGLQRELEETSEETGHWQNMFQKNKEELRATKQE